MSGQKKERNPTSKHGDAFIRLRRGFMKHFRDGWVDGDMFTAYCVMLDNCNFATGIWHGSADALAAASGGQWSTATAVRILKRLALGRYITSTHVRGVRGNYDVLINNFEPTKGPLKGKRLRKTITQNWSKVTSDSTSEVAGESVEDHQRLCTESPAICNQDSTSAAPPSLPQDQTQDQKQRKEGRKGVAGLASLDTAVDGLGAENKSTPSDPVPSEQSKGESKATPTPTPLDQAPRTAQVLFDALYPVRTPQLWLEQGDACIAAAEMLDAVRVHAAPLVRYNRLHKSGRLLYHSAKQVLASLSKADVRIVNEMLEHPRETCQKCKDGKFVYVELQKPENPGCAKCDPERTGPTCLWHQYPKPELAPFRHHKLSKEDEKRFTADFRDGWEDGCLNSAVSRGVLTKREADATIHWCLEHMPRPVTYGEFLALAWAAHEQDDLRSKAAAAGGLSRDEGDD